MVNAAMKPVVIGSLAAEAVEPRQVRKEAALRRILWVPRITWLPSVSWLHFVNEVGDCGLAFGRVCHHQPLFFR